MAKHDRAHAQREKKKTQCTGLKSADCSGSKSMVQKPQVTEREKKSAKKEQTSFCTAEEQKSLSQVSSN